MWTYSQSAGSMRDGAGAIVAIGYSGHGDGVNTPSLQDVPDVGPCPQGLWSIGPPQDTETHGPYVMALTPHADTMTFGRSGFLIHGDRVDAIGQRLASEGCIIMPPDARHAIWESGDHVLKVVA